jgi:hypothetical protein
VVPTINETSRISHDKVKKTGHHGAHQNQSKILIPGTKKEHKISKAAAFVKPTNQGRTP